MLDFARFKLVSEIARSAKADATISRPPLSLSIERAGHALGAPASPVLARRKVARLDRGPLLCMVLDAEAALARRRARRQLALLLALELLTLAPPLCGTLPLVLRLELRVQHLR